MDTQLDDRRGLPSASNWRRYELCHGSWALEQEARRIGQEAHKQSLAAASGERQHAALAGQQVELQGGEGVSVAFLNERTEEQVVRIFGTKDVPCINERRLWLDYNGKRALSGRFDRVYFTEKLALVIDYKTGWWEVDPAETNSQLKVLAVLVGIALPTVEEIVAMIISGPFGITEARYDLTALSEAYREIIATLRAINDPNARFAPSPEACRYCPATMICQAYRVATVAPVAKVQIAELPLEPERAAKLLDEVGMLRRLCDQVEEFYADKLQADPSFAIPNYAMVPGPQRRAVDDWRAARNRLEEFIEPEWLDGLMSFSIPNVEKLLAKSLNIKAKEAGTKLAQILGDLLAVKPGNLVLKRVKGEARVAALVE